MNAATFDDWHVFRFLSPFFFVIPMTISCSAANDYSGDGKLVDNGMLAATDRYVLDLGSISLKSQGGRTYRLENLPSTSFVIGIDVGAPSSSFPVLEKKPIRSSVSISLMGPDGKPVFSTAGELASWTWSIPSTGERAFVYKDGSLGSSFTPTTKTAYELRVEVLKPDSGNLQYEATLKAKSGGWK